MFERNRSDNQDRTSVGVRLALADGEEITAKLPMPQGRSVFDMLNASPAFFEIETLEGERTYVSKVSLKSMCLIDMPRGQSLEQRTHDRDGFDPHSVLGLAQSADLVTARTAYHALARTYHPDRFANLELPDEVRAYVETMARRVNAAFAAIEAADKERARRSARRQPVTGFGPAHRSAPSAA